MGAARTRRPAKGKGKGKNKGSRRRAEAATPRSGPDETVMIIKLVDDDGHTEAAFELTGAEREGPSEEDWMKR